MINTSDIKSNTFIGFRRPMPSKLQSWFTKSYFFLILIIIFCLSGVLEMVTGGMYRQSFAILLLIPLFFVYAPRFDAVFVIAPLLVVSVFFSALLGNSTLSNILLFARGPISAYLVYHVVCGWISSHPANIKLLWRFLFVVGVIQLPVIFLQRIFWREMAAYISDGLSWAVDAGFGTFPVKSDYSMSFFLVILILVLMYSNAGSLSQRCRWFLLVFYSFTVLGANSQIAQIALLTIWFVYLLTHIKFQIIMTTALAMVLIILTLSRLQEVGLIPIDFSVTFREVQTQLAGETDRRGNFSRGATLRFFLTEPVDWFGKGPGFYYDVVNRQIEGMDIQGHLLTYYAETGIVGLILSYSLLWVMARPFVVRNSIRFRMMSFLAFLSISIMSLTSYVLNQLPMTSIYMLAIATVYSEHSYLRKPASILRNVHELQEVSNPILNDSRIDVVV